MYIGSRLLGNIFVIITTLYILLNLGVIAYMFSSEGGNWDIGVAFFSIPLLVLVFGTFLFKRNYKLGWYVLVMFSIYASLNQIVYFLKNSGLIENGKTDLFMLLPDIPKSLNLIAGLLFSGMVVLLNKEEIRFDYSVKKTESISVSIIAVSIFSVLFII